MPLESIVSPHQKNPLFPVVVIGTRAQLIKMAPVMLEFQSRRIKYRLVFTGQHLVTMQELLDDFRIIAQPIWLGEKTEVDRMSKMLGWFFKAFWKLTVSKRELLKGPDGRRGLIVVHGDTISTLLGGLAGRLNRCKVAHVESGLRSFSLRDPFPEELTRVLVFHLANIAFCPGPWAMRNMARYRVTSIDTGHNTLLDAVKLVLRDRASEAPDENLPLCVVSVHRFENLHSNQRLRWILSIVREIATEYRVEFVMHPATKARLQRTSEYRELEEQSSISIRDRMGYRSFISLLFDASFVLTDGGSNQEELYYMGKPTLIVRQRSERPEGIGCNAEMLNLDKRKSWRSALETIRARAVRPLPLSSDNSPSRIIVDTIATGVP